MLTHPTEIYPLSLHDALPIFASATICPMIDTGVAPMALRMPISRVRSATDRKSTRLNSSPLVISYAAFGFQKTTSVLRESVAGLDAGERNRPRPVEGVANVGI